MESSALFAGMQPHMSANMSPQLTQSLGTRYDFAYGASNAVQAAVCIVHALPFYILLMCFYECNRLTHVCHRLCGLLISPLAVAEACPLRIGGYCVQCQ